MDPSTEMIRAKSERDRWQIVVVLCVVPFLIFIGLAWFAIRFDSKAATTLAFIACLLITGYMMFAWIRMLAAHFELRRLQRKQ
jgi:hypothetical protein